MITGRSPIGCQRSPSGEVATQIPARGLPAGLDYAQVTGLRTESRERLAAHHPLTLAQASRIIGVTPADIMVLMVHLSGRKKA